MTLRHIVSWKLAGDTREERDDVAARVTALLAPLAETIPQVRALSVHRNELHDGQNHDLTLIADFDDAEGLAGYASHPNHQPAIELLREVSVARTATDFTV